VLAAKRDLEGLVKALRDDDTREQAAEAIVALEDPAVIEPLEKLATKAVTGRDSNEAAIETLRRLDPDTALPTLLERCAEGSPTAARVIAAWGDDIALGPLIEMRAHERMAGSVGAYLGLLELGTESALAAVADGLERGPNQLSAFRSVSIGWKGTEPEVLRACFAPYRVEPFEGSDEAKVADKILRSVAERVRENEVDSDGPTAVFVEMLSDPADNVRLVAAMLLIQSTPEKGLGPPDPRTAEALDRACRDEFRGVRVMAAQALSRQGDSRALGYLMALLDEEDAVAIEAMSSIRDLAEKSGLPEEEGRLIVARNEAEGTKSRLQPHLAVVTGLVHRQARRERKAAAVDGAGST
jgi:HEAT repeat protein